MAALRLAAAARTAAARRVLWAPCSVAVFSPPRAPPFAPARQHGAVAPSTAAAARRWRPVHDPVADEDAADEDAEAALRQRADDFAPRHTGAADKAARGGGPAAPTLEHRPDGNALEDIGGERFRKRERLNDPVAFSRVYREGRHSVLEHVHVFALPNAWDSDATCTRIGIAASKKRLKRAVDRNLARRRIRDAFRRNKGDFPERADLVFVPLASIVDADFAALRDELVEWGRWYSELPGGERGNGGGGKRRRGGRTGGKRGGGGNKRGGGGGTQGKAGKPGAAATA